MVKVYIKIDSNSYITDITSSIFMKDTGGWIQIDEGSGDRYVHAQGNYLPGPIRDEEGNYRYKYINGKIYERFNNKNTTNFYDQYRLINLE